MKQGISDNKIFQATMYFRQQGISYNRVFQATHLILRLQGISGNKVFKTKFKVE